MAYDIYAKFKGQVEEVVDTAENSIERDYLLQEYRMAFGNDCIVSYKRTRPKKGSKDEQHK